MSAKDRYTMTFHCPQCKSEGSADLSENDHAYAPPETSVDAVRGGFRSVLSSPRGNSVITFYCTLCGVEAV